LMFKMSEPHIIYFDGGDNFVIADLSKFYFMQLQQ